MTQKVKWNAYLALQFCFNNFKKKYLKKSTNRFTNQV